MGPYLQNKVDQKALHLENVSIKKLLQISPNLN